MTVQRIRTMATVAALLVPLPAWAAQQPGHQMGTAQAQPALQAMVAECAQAQPLVMRTIDAANMRLEAARQNNSPSAMRAAVDDLQGALRDLRAQLAACATLHAAAAPDPHALPSTQPPAAAPPATPAMKPGSTTPAPASPAAADPHAGHTTPKAQQAPAAPAGKPATKPGSAKPAPPAPERDPHAGHGMTAPSAQEAKPAKVMDPVNGLMVDPTTAPKTTYQGQTYYFSSEETRKEFLQNPAKFARKPKQ